MYSDHDLLAMLREGEEPAFRELYSRYNRRILAFAYHLTHSAIDAEDILQETFFRLWTNREQLPEILHVENYIFMIARNKTLDHLRKISLQQKLLDQVWANISEVSDNLDLQLDAEESRRLIGEALAQLSPQKQTIFQLSRYQGMNHAQIADAMELSRSRVKNLLVETLKYIRTYLSQRSLLLAALFAMVIR